MADDEKKQEKFNLENFLKSYGNLNTKNLEESLNKHKEYYEKEHVKLLDSITNALSKSYTLASEKFNKLSENDLNKNLVDLDEKEIKKSLAEIAEEELKMLHPEHYKVIDDLLGLKGDKRIDAILDMHSKVSGYDAQGRPTADYNSLLKALKKQGGTIGDLLGYFRKFEDNIKKRVNYHVSKMQDYLFDKYQPHEFIKYMHETAKRKGHELIKEQIVGLDKQSLLESAIHMHGDSYQSKEHAKSLAVNLNKNKEKIYSAAEETLKKAV